MITFPPQLTLESVHNLLGRPTDLCDDVTILNFSRTTFSDPTASLFLIRWVEAARALGYTVTPNWGSYQEVAPDGVAPKGHDRWIFYNQFSGFQGALDLGQVQTFEDSKKRYVRYQMLDLSSYRALREQSDEGEARNVIKTFGENLGKATYGNSKDVAVFGRCLAELVENVVWYAGDTAHCYIMAQLRQLSEVERNQLARSKIVATKKLELAILDEGVGLLASLSGKSNARDHQSAIDAAVTPGVSSTQGADRGYGLALLREAASKGGMMDIATNDDEGDGALVSYRLGKRKPVKHYPLPGTLVGFSILPEKVNLDEIEAGLKESHGRNHETIRERP